MVFCVPSGLGGFCWKGDEGMHNLDLMAGRGYRVTETPTAVSNGRSWRRARSLKSVKVDHVGLED
jgi:hypothetical protein